MLLKELVVGLGAKNIVFDVPTIPSFDREFLKNLKVNSFLVKNHIFTFLFGQNSFFSP